MKACILGGDHSVSQEEYSLDFDVNIMKSWMFVFGHDWFYQMIKLSQSPPFLKRMFSHKRLKRAFDKRKFSIAHITVSSILSRNLQVIDTILHTIHAMYVNRKYKFLKRFLYNDAYLDDITKATILSQDDSLPTLEAYSYFKELLDKLDLTFKWTNTESSREEEIYSFTLTALEKRKYNGLCYIIKNAQVFESESQTEEILDVAARSSAPEVVQYILSNSKSISQDTLDLALVNASIFVLLWRLPENFDPNAFTECIRILLDNGAHPDAHLRLAVKKASKKSMRLSQST